MKGKIWLLFYTFCAVFQPPFLPINFIYLLGIVTIFLLRKEGKKMILYIAKESNILPFAHFIIKLTIYFVFINIIDILFIESADLFVTRIRCFNQLFVLSLFQCLFVVYLIIQFEKRNFQFKDIIVLLVEVGVIQGLCALVAFYVPVVRDIFMMFGDRSLYDNAFFLERRGYGFSMTLIDTFGYGIGLIVGYLVILKWEGYKILKLFSFGLMMFTILINARTGVVVTIIAFAIKLLVDKKMSKTIVYILIFSIVLYFLKELLPILLDMGVHSENPTIVWICSDFQELYYILFELETLNSQDITNVTFLSNFVKLPSNSFEFLLGSGHYVYDTGKELGFRTDIGYYNMFWEFGILGSTVILIYFFKLIGKPFFIALSIEQKKIAVFNIVCYGFLLLKAILLGFNPGVFINYLITFSLYYYIRKERKLVI